MLRPILDTAQVMPVFVYLGVLVLAFGIQYPPAVIATIVYAVPPAVRLTNHGLRGVPVVMTEVGESFGCTVRQQLVKVQLPFARRTILLGLNQVIMMAFGIVVIGSLLGTGDIGGEVLEGAAEERRRAPPPRRAWRSCSPPSPSTASPPASVTRARSWSA